MRLVHCADLHLGFRSYQRLAPDGSNQRERDVEASFGVVVDRIIALAPDLVVIGGDVFHYARPTTNSVLAAFTGFARLTRALPNAVVCIAAGNHDISKESGNDCILKLFESLGVHVADRQSQRFYFPDRDLSVLCVPDAPSLNRPVIAPDPRARFNVLCLHGEIQGMLPTWQGGGGSERGAIEISHEEIGVEAWTYVGLGHYHVYRELAPNMFYSGSIDYTSRNIWGERTEERAAGIGGKGIVCRDLATGAHEFHAIPASRSIIDLPPIDAHGMGAEQLDAAIRDAAASAGDLTGCVVRLIVEGVSRELGRALDQKNLKAVRRGTLNFQIDLRRPVYVESALSMMVRGVDQPGARAKTVEERTREKLESRELVPDVDRGDLITAAMKYLNLATEKDLPRAVEEETDLVPAAPRHESAA